MTIQRDIPEARSRQARGDRGRRDGDKRAIRMNDAIKPAIGNIDGKKNASRTQGTANLSEGAVLQFRGAKMVKNENRDASGKSAVRKRQRRSISLQYCAIRTVVAGGKPCGEFVIVFETGHACRAFAQLRRCCSRSGADLEHMVAQVHAMENPRKDLFPSKVAPNRRSAKPILKPIHKISLGGEFLGL